VQLPFAGVDAFKDVLGVDVRFTSAKGAYREPVAEHALALALALGRKLPVRIRATSWGKREATSFFDSEVLIVGGGGIAEELLNLLAPFRANVTVVRNRPERKLPGASNTLGLVSLPTLLPKANLVIIAAALTDETRGLFDFEMLSRMNPNAFLVNVARGPIVNTLDLIRALDENLIAGAALDVTDPEPLPDGHPAFGRQDLIITPHTADTKEIVIRLFSRRIAENVAAYLGKSAWVGEVDPELGY
jgi:phosphoglycerate dehydrogenase-like enzyme